jgi:YD repeat-containing protein
MKPIAALTLLSFFSPSASADVNMLDASFRQTFIDAKIASLKIERSYDSRSTFTGVFGFGWCSTFDTELDTKSLTVKDCGRPTANPTTRYTDGTYVQTLKSGLTRIFDADSGALIALRSESGGTVAIESGPGADARRRLPRAAALGEGFKTRPETHLKVTLEYDALHENITAIQTPTARLLYEYSDKRDLLSAKNAWSNTYRFDYDRLHNLTSARYPDGSEELLTYDSDRDRLTKYQGRDGCIETYEHTISQSADEKTQISKAFLTCNGQAKRQAVFRFGFIRKNNQWTLSSFNRGQK